MSSSSTGNAAHARVPAQVFLPNGSMCLGFRLQEGQEKRRRRTISA